MAPEGMSTFYALVPVAHMGKLAVDWEEEVEPSLWAARLVLRE